MITVDQLYGAIEIPKWLHPVILSPEVQRLRDVRLINTSSPTCGSLSDARRFTHTLGVFSLAARLESKLLCVWPKEQAKAFCAAAMLHDVGTPPFGHLFEYQLIVSRGWSHEKFVSDIIQGTYRPEKRYHQIYFSNPLGLHEALKWLDIDSDFVAAIVRGGNPIGSILAGSIDIDNLDNVYRMAAMLGLKPDVGTPYKLVEEMTIDENGLGFNSSSISMVSEWQNTRRRVYQVLAFDEGCLSGQAMLTECIVAALETNQLSEEQWFFTDEELLRYLWHLPETKYLIQRFAIGNFFDTVFLGWFSVPKGNKDLREPKHRQELSSRLQEAVKVPCCPYVFYDNGTFSKNLSLRISQKCSAVDIIEIGEKSISTIVSIFTPNHVDETNRRRMRPRVLEVLRDYGFFTADLMDIPSKQDIYELPGQKKLPI